MKLLKKQWRKNKNHAYIKPIYFPELNRTESLKKDLDFHYGDNWLEGMTLSPATKAYVDRITQIRRRETRITGSTCLH